MNETTDAKLQAWCEKVASLGSDMLVERGIIKREVVAIAAQLIAEEIRIRIVMGDKPPST
jgi:hypothetical protein